MQVREKSGQTLTEPVTTAEFKTFSGYSGTDQDSLISSLITSARQFLENETGLSCIPKSYQCEFYRYDVYFDELDQLGWFTLPFSPVTSITSVTIGGVATTYSQKGLKRVEICPDQVISTGTTNNAIAVEFIAGESNTQIKNAILRIVSDMFNNREDNVSSVSMAMLSFDTRRMIANLSTNVEI